VFCSPVTDDSPRQPKKPETTESENDWMLYVTIVPLNLTTTGSCT